MLGADRSKAIGLLLLFGLVAGGLVWLATALLSKSDFGGPGWSLRGNGALIVMFALLPALLAAGWVGVAERAGGPHLPGSRVSDDANPQSRAYPGSHVSDGAKAPGRVLPGSRVSDGPNAQSRALPGSRVSGGAKAPGRVLPGSRVSDDAKPPGRAWLRSAVLAALAILLLELCVGFGPIFAGPEAALSLSLPLIVLTPALALLVGLAIAGGGLRAGVVVCLLTIALNLAIPGMWFYLLPLLLPFVLATPVLARAFEWHLVLESLGWLVALLLGVYGAQSLLPA